MNALKLFYRRHKTCIDRSLRTLLQVFFSVTVAALVGGEDFAAFMSNWLDGGDICFSAAALSAIMNYKADKIELRERGNL